MNWRRNWHLNFTPADERLFNRLFEERGADLDEPEAVFSESQVEAFREAQTEAFAAVQTKAEADGYAEAAAKKDKAA